MPLVIVKGNLLESEAQVLAHQANCFSTMGAGIAKQIAVRWPAASRADRLYFPNAPMDKLGKCSRALVDSNTRFIYNLYGQYNYGSGKQQTNYEALEKSLRMMLDEIKQLETFKSLRIGIPYGMGCGLAGGSWPIVSKMVGDVADEYGITIYAYQL